MDRPATPAFEPNLLARLPSVPRKVAIVRASRIGDYICATPALTLLRRALPAAEIALVALPIVEPLATRLPAVDRFIPFPGFPGIAEQFYHPDRAAAFFHAMRRERFDLAIQLHGSGVCSNPFTLRLGAAATAGMIRDGDASGQLDAAFPVPEQLHEVDRLVAFARFLGAPPGKPPLQLPLRDADRAAAREAVRPCSPPLIAVHPGAREATKRWPASRFSAAAGALRRAAGGTVVVIGADEERDAAGRIEREVGPGCLNLAGRLSLAATAAVVELASVLIANDSAPAHIAYALGTPSVTIFGGTEVARWGPQRQGTHRVLARSVPCRPCSGDRCPHGYACLDGISPSEVVAEVERLWAAGRFRRRSFGVSAS